MRISLHGGNCCGIKHIDGLGFYPDNKLAARKPRKMTPFGQIIYNGSNDMKRSNKYGNYDFFNEAAPKETYEERLKRFVEFIETNRPHGVIEVVINIAQSKWRPVLEGLGFKLVSSGKNSNTHGTISIYHLVY